MCQSKRIKNQVNPYKQWSASIELWKTSKYTLCIDLLKILIVPALEVLEWLCDNTHSILNDIMHIIKILMPKKAIESPDLKFFSKILQFYRIQVCLNQFLRYQSLFHLISITISIIFPNMNTWIKAKKTKITNFSGHVN